MLHVTGVDKVKSKKKKQQSATEEFQERKMRITIFTLFIVAGKSLRMLSFFWLDSNLNCNPN